MGETFVLFSPPIQMEGIEDTATQQVKNNLRCLLKPLKYLTCKHIIHYNCINNLQKLCPICPSTNIEPEEEEEMSVNGKEQSDTSSKKRSNESMDVNSSSPKKKAKKAVKREDLPILKKLIKELFAPILQQSSFDSIISLQTFLDIDINLVNFCELDNKIINTEDGNKKTILEVIHAYYYFEKGYRLWFDHYKKTYSKDTSNSLVNDKIREHFPDQDKVSETNLRKRKERAIKIFKLFDGVGGEGKIYCIKSFSASTILRLGMDDINYVKAKF
ncbi:8179_t:CDS:2 [Scutellospora calospora]|uniref:8179_t:CDS:1 n=1 Tax=Scutellospora calospora TaxID=85575 RepID=A0ACA9M5U4_9GLOM|nr:8179_t:CDS:2 [Scutellospora calospora]